MPSGSVKSRKLIVFTPWILRRKDRDGSGRHFHQPPFYNQVHAATFRQPEKDADIKYLNSNFISIPVSDSYSTFHTGSLSFTIDFHLSLIFVVLCYPHFERSRWPSRQYL